MARLEHKYRTCRGDLEESRLREARGAEELRATEAELRSTQAALRTSRAQLEDERAKVKSLQAKQNAHNLVVEPRCSRRGSRR